MISPQLLMMLQGGLNSEEDDSEMMPEMTAEMPFMFPSQFQGNESPQIIARPQGAVRHHGVSALGRRLPQVNNRFQDMIPSQNDDRLQGAVHPQGGAHLQGVGSLYAGAQEGVEALRGLTRTSDEDQRRSIGMGLMRLFSGMGKTGYGSGLKGTLGALSENIPEAMSSYTSHLDKRKAQNMEELKAFMTHQNDLREYNQKLLEMSKKQNQETRDFLEKQRHNRAQEENWRRVAQRASFYSGGNISPELLAQIPGLGNAPAIASQRERSDYIHDRRNFGQVLGELKSIRKDWNAFRELSKDDLIDPQAPYGLGSLANTVGDLVGTVWDDPHLRKQTVKRRALEGSLGRFNIGFEKKLKGGGLSEQFLKRFEDKGLLPSLNDRADVFEENLSKLEHEISRYEKIATLALQTGRALIPEDLEDLEAPETSDVPETSEVPDASGQGASQAVPINPYRDAVNGLSYEELQQLQNKIAKDKAAEAQKGDDRHQGNQHLQEGHRIQGVRP